MLNFTKGKWNARDFNIIRDEKEKAIALVCYRCKSEEHPSATMDANARLIAAAPELFALVQKLAECQPHEFSELKLQAHKLLDNLQETNND